VRAVFVNHCHPDTPHVCATRMREFAWAMARRGHQIILLTETLDGASGNLSPDAVAEEIRKHDFSSPYYLACPPSGVRAARMLRTGQLPWGVRQSVILWLFFRHHGVFTDWLEGVRQIRETLANEFKPDLVWGTFGNTDCWNISRDLAHQATCPWIADIKDPWQVFIPTLLRARLARQYADAALMTAFSNTHASAADVYFSQEKRVIHSGVDPQPIARAEVYSGDDDIWISLTGSVYAPDNTSTLFSAIASWAARIDDNTRSKVTFHYAGAEAEAIEAQLGQLKTLINTRIQGRLSQQDYFDLLKSCQLNFYITNKNTFHQKTLELLSMGRPVASFPAETDEALGIAKRYGSTLYSCSTASDVKCALDSVLSIPGTVDATTGMEAAYSWDALAGKLEDVFNAVIEDGPD
jgi:glycosyltransferase involved in cell wall biosynthesis